MVDVIGLDHIYLTVTDMQVSEKFYDRVLMSVLEFRKNQFSIHDDHHIQYFNRLLGIVIRPAKSADMHNPYAAGLHHLCFRVETAEDVRQVAIQLQKLGIAASQPRIYGEYASDYVATFFTDPDGIRLEVTNYRQERKDRFEQWN